MNGVSNNSFMETDSLKQPWAEMGTYQFYCFQERNSAWKKFCPLSYFTFAKTQQQMLESNNVGILSLRVGERK